MDRPAPGMLLSSGDMSFRQSQTIWGRAIWNQATNGGGTASDDLYNVPVEARDADSSLNDVSAAISGRVTGVNFKMVSSALLVGSTRDLVTSLTAVEL